MDHAVSYDQLGQVYASEDLASSSIQPSDRNHVEPACYWPPFDETPDFTTPAFVNTPAAMFGNQTDSFRLEAAGFDPQAAMPVDQTNFDINSMPFYDSSNFVENTAFAPQPGPFDPNLGLDLFQNPFQDIPAAAFSSMQQADFGAPGTQLNLDPNWLPFQEPHAGASCTTPFAMPLPEHTKVALPSRTRGFPQTSALSAPVVPFLGNGGAAGSENYANQAGTLGMNLQTGLPPGASPTTRIRFPCTHCPKDFGRKAEMQRHLDNIHLKRSAFWCRDAGCPRGEHLFGGRQGRSFPRADKRNEHEWKVHGLKI
ncbi:hypothetical protein BU16DRAFT_544351 [Lophium mytilinum]|uniref:C2H2-type domain-containing protein n=1 Tax=Lophium mytilinum TaxID=390894 RepID=A0A6A6QEU6_9PEZI|nr:hypothetical protein BU16DRAFT_544351 [Lophium mytilinum]